MSLTLRGVHVQEMTTYVEGGPVLVVVLRSRNALRRVKEALGPDEHSLAVLEVRLFAADTSIRSSPEMETPP